MGSEPGNRTSVYCTLALKYKPSFTCTLLLYHPASDASSIRDTWYRLRNHEVLKLESNEGQWFVSADDNLQLQSSKRAHIALFGVPINFFHMINHGGKLMYTGEGIMRSANLPLLYTIRA